MARILFFGRLSDFAEAIEAPLPDGVRDTDALTAWLSRENARLGEALARPGVRVIVNNAFISAPLELSDTDEIAFTSPLSGG
ncbi:MAG: MoaD/ThiS family protein [Pseudomonadota bacterium]